MTKMIWRAIGVIIACFAAVSAITLYKDGSPILPWAAISFLLGMLLVGIYVRVEHGFWPLDDD